jgi:hypothetical protein
VAALVIIGIALVVFGGFVLLRFPDRPGGTIAWHGFGVSSVGAGLPLIVLGVGAIAAGGILYEDDGSGSPTRTGAGTTRPIAGNGNCLTSLLADIAPERKATLPAPTINRTVIGPSETKRGMIGLRLTDRGHAVGAIRLSYDPDAMIFMIDTLVDAACEPIAPAAYTSLAGDVDGRRNTLIQYDDVKIAFGARAYVLQVGGGADIRFSFSRFRS